MLRPIEKKEFLTADEVGELLSCTGRHVRNLLREGKLRGHLIGTIWRIPVAEIDAFLERTASKPKAA